MSKTQNIVIENFKLSTFKQLLNQSLMVDNQIMLNFNSKMIKSVSFTTTKTFIKLWTIPLKSLIIQPDVIDETSVDDVLDLDSKPKKDKYKLPKFKEFDCYILKGDLFKKFLSVYNEETVDLTFEIVETDEGNLQAASIIFKGYGASKTLLQTKFILSTEDLLTNKVDDYNQIITECTPSKEMYEFIIGNKQIQEIKRLIKTLHKTIANNVAYLSFNINIEDKKIVVNDKVFELEISIDEKTIFPKESFDFKILKSDFVVTGNHDFSIYMDNIEKKILLGAKYANSIIWGLITKTSEKTLNMNDNISDSTIESLDVSEYLDDDLAF